MKPVIAIVGRPNVGKSTLFNRIAGKRLAIVEDLPGVTRDRHYADADWDGKAFTLVDTGGFLPDSADVLLRQVRDQARLAIDEAQAVILVTDGMAGLTTADEEVAAMLRKSGKPTYVAVNKIDSTKREEMGEVAEAYRLGISEVFPTSAEHGRGVGDLLDAVVKSFERLPEEEPVEGRPCRVAILGRPNVGKSTLINALLGEARMVSSPIPGTTRDPVDSELEVEGFNFVLTDTAGIRRKRSIAQKVEQFSVFRAFKALDDCDVAVLLMDATLPAVDQDAKIAALAVEKGKALVLCINKWDLVEKHPQVAANYRERIKQELSFVAYAPVIFTSALSGDKVSKVLDLARSLFEQMENKVPTPKLNQMLQRTVDAHAPPMDGHRPVRLYYIAQVGRRPPTFSITANRPNAVNETYRRYLMNQLREVFGLRVPIKLLFKPRPGHNRRRAEGER